MCKKVYICDKKCQGARINFFCTKKREMISFNCFTHVVHFLQEIIMKSSNRAKFKLNIEFGIE